MEENKRFTLKQTQTGDDSGYSCTSTQSKYSVKSSHSQSASSGDSCFDEQRSTKLGSTKKGLETTINQESNNKNSKSKQINITEFEPTINKIFIIDELKLPQSTSKVEFGEPKHLIEDTKKDHDQNNTTFHHLADLCQSYHKQKNTKTQTSNLNDEFPINGMY
uniref:Uncharacterized protein n=1 Tax=Sipha flava TaxID=143950 RepID=A0A2S2Q9L7_9HEMI